MTNHVVAVASIALLTACSSQPPNVKCDGTVFFVSVGCHEVASAGPMVPVRTSNEVGPASQPSREEVGPASQPSAPPPPPARPVSHEEKKPIKPTPVAEVEAPPPPPPAAAPEPPPAQVLPPPVNVVYFKMGSAEVTYDAKIVLESIADYLKKASDEKIVLHSFVDPTGGTVKNRQLLETRSAAVKKYLADEGVDPSRIDLPRSAIHKAPRTYPANEFWRLRKVEVGYSSKVRELAVAKEQAEDLEAEEDAKPEKTAVELRSATMGEALARNPQVESKGDRASDEKKGGKEKIDVLYWRSTNHSLFLIAKARGFFESEGFDVRLHAGDQLEASQISTAVAEGAGTSQFAGVGSAAPVSKRKYFMGGVCPIGLHQDLAKNIPLVQIGGLLDQPVTVVMHKDLLEQVKRDLKSFSGHSWGHVKDSKVPELVVKTRLFPNALNNAKIPFKEKSYGTPYETEMALVRGEVDAIQSTPPWDAAMVERHPDLLGIFELRTLFPHMTCCRQVVTREQLKDKKTREKYVRFERAMILAHKYYKEHKSESSELVAKVLKMKPSTVRSIFMRPGFSLDPNPNTKGAVAFSNSLHGAVGKQDIRESIDTSVYEEALFSLAKENPSDEYYKNAIREYRATN